MTPLMPMLWKWSVLFSRRVETDATRPIRTLFDPGPEPGGFVPGQRGEFSTLLHGRHFEIFHLILHEAEQWVGAGVAGDHRWFAARAPSKQRRAIRDLEAALGTLAVVADHAGAFEQGLDVAGEFDWHHVVTTRRGDCRRG